MLVILLSAICAAQGRAASVPYLVRDINTLPNDEASSFPKQFQVVGGVAYFRAEFDLGAQLWRSDGSSVGTTVVKDVAPDSLTAAGDRLFFFTAAAEGGTELWVSDGIPDGTTAVTILRGDGVSPLVDAKPDHVTPVGRDIFFAADDGVHGRELWRSDGTSEGTHMLEDIRPGSASAVIAGSSKLAVLDGLLYFFASSGGSPQLWRSDGTAEGTQAFHPAFPAYSVIGRDTPIVAAQGRLWFISNDQGGLPEPWISDATFAGTHRLKDGGPIADPFNPESFTAVANRVYFVAASDDEGTELWRSDGTAEGTQLAADLESGSSGSQPRDLTAVGDALFFSAVTPVDSHLLRRQLWRADADNVAQPGAIPFPANLAAGHGLLYFTANVSTCTVCDYYPWRSDGTPAGTMKLTAAGTPLLRASNFTEIEDTVLFGADDQIVGHELWATDGTDAGTHLVRDLFASTGSGVDGGVHIASLGQRVFFPATDGSGAQLWSSDGTEAGTTEVATFDLPRSQRIGDLTRSGNELYFFDARSETGFWRSDGSGEGTHQVLAFAPGTVASPAPVAATGLVFFGAYYAAKNQLWRSDGSAAGTYPVADFSGDAPPSNLQGGEDALYFTEGTELWRSDGSEEGTHLVRDLGHAIDQIEVVGGRVFATTGLCSIHGGPVGELWTSDGTSDGTQLLRQDVCAALGTVSFDDKLYFLSQRTEGSQSEALFWASDGTADGTHVVRTLPAPFAYGLIRGAHGLTFFSPNPNDATVWSSDGTSEGTKAVANVTGTPGALSIVAAQTGRGRVYFIAKDYGDGQRPLILTLWVTDGTPAGTKALSILPGRPDYFGNPSLAVNDTHTHLFFSGYRSDTGDELWAYQIANAGECVGDCDNNGSLSVEELITGVFLALGETAASCTVYGGGPVTVDRLVAAVNARRLGCGDASGSR